MNTTNFDLNNLNISNIKQINDKLKIALINNNNKLLIELPENYLINNSNNQINTIINNNTICFLDELKKKIVNIVNSNSREIYGYQKNIKTLNDFYCNPHKITMSGSFYEDYININGNTTNTTNTTNNNQITNNSLVKVVIHIYGLWFSEKSYGPIINLSSIDLIKESNSYLFWDSDSSIEL